MIAESNSLLLDINKFVVTFLNALNIDDDVRSTTIDTWKSKANSNKLKTVFRKNGGKQPKRVMNKYLYFCQEERVTILRENPTMAIKDVTCELGKRWQSFQLNPDMDRLKRITDLFLEDKKRYETDKDDMKQHKPVRHYTKTPYVRFCEDQRRENPKISMKELGHKWKIVKTDAAELIRYTTPIDNL